MSQGQARNQRPLRFLSFDGGGVRGLSSLVILGEIMKQYNARRRELDASAVEIHPWQVFDLICGTSTGGLIAIMLGRLRMPVAAAIEAYAALSEYIFGTTKPWFWQEGTFQATRLEYAIKLLVGMYAEPRPGSNPRMAFDSNHKEENNHYVKAGADVPMLDKRDDRCHVIVCAVTADPISTVRFRTYHGSSSSPECRIWEAARATSAAPTYFKPVYIDKHGIEIRYLDAGLQCNNPIEQLTSEISEYARFKNRRVSCILSIGTGERYEASLPKAGWFPKLQLVGVVKSLKKIVLDCETVHQRTERRFAHNLGIYHRLNVAHGFQTIGLQEWKALDQLITSTGHYMRQPEIVTKFNSVVDSLLRTGEQGTITVRNAGGLL